MNESSSQARIVAQTGRPVSSIGNLLQLGSLYDL